MKDVAILDAEHMIVLSCDKGPISGQRLPNGSVSDYEFTDMKKIPCAGFPHGVAVRGDMIAYTVECQI